MLSNVVVPVEPVCQVFGKLSAGFESLQIDSFVLQYAPESFDGNIALNNRNTFTPATQFVFFS